MFQEFISKTEEKQMHNRIFLTVLVACVALAAQGCATGYNHSLVSNSANIGFDLNAEPGKLEGAISSTSGGMTPTFEGGQTLPLLANISTKSTPMGQFFKGSASTVITGDAAYSMSYLYADCNKNVSDVKDIPDVNLTKKPETVPGPGEVKPAVFMTSSMLGAHISLGRQSPVAPSAIKVGFNRHESVIAPITVTKGKSSAYIAGTPSMIATLDHWGDIEGRKGLNSNGSTKPLKYAQYFSTGTAAENMALRSDVRRDTLHRINPYMQDSFCEDDFETKTR